MARLREQYQKEIKQALKKQFGYKNDFQAPKLEKIVINMGVGEGSRDSKCIDSAFEDLKVIAGQCPVVTKSKKSIAGFKIRDGMDIGVKVTLRNVRMYEFLDRLVNIAMPRIRDFQGISPKSFDGRGNYAMGIKEQIVFPEVDYDKIDKIRGMDIIFVTTATTDDEGRALLKSFGMPFRS